MSFSSQPGKKVDWVVYLPQELCGHLQAAAVEDEGGPPGSFHFSSTLSDTSSLPTPTSLRTTSSHSVASVAPPMQDGGVRDLHKTDSVLTLGPVRSVDLNQAVFNVCDPAFSTRKARGLLEL